MFQIPDELIAKMRAAKSVCVLTGAGVSAESGVPTFRGGGQSAVWKGMPFDQISSARMVREDLDEVWEWFDHRRGILSKCAPNPAHFAMAEMQHKFKDFTLVTQNIDGLHAAAGSKKVLELHGNINRAYCTRCGKRFELKKDTIPHEPAKCDVCVAKLRPDVVLFGEMLPTKIFAEADEAARRCAVFLVVGTTSLVYPAAGLTEIAKSRCAVIIEINPEITAATGIVDFSLRGKAGEILPELLKRLATE